MTAYVPLQFMHANTLVFCLSAFIGSLPLHSIYNHAHRATNNRSVAPPGEKK